MYSPTFQTWRFARLRTISLIQYKQINSIRQEQTNEDPKKSHRILLYERLHSLIIFGSEDMLPLHQLFAKHNQKSPTLKVQNKEDFFKSKNNLKKMKSSVCFSEQIEKYSPQDNSQDISLTSLRDSPRLKLDNKQLDSTFGEQRDFAFRPKPPKRKLNVRIGAKECQATQLERSKSGSSLFVKKLSCSQQQANFQLTIPTKKTRQLNISDFILGPKMGEGSYSSVFKAVEKKTGFLCALKVLAKEQMRELQVGINVLREIKIHLFVDHPNISKLYGCFSDAKNLYLICQYATDKNLYQALYQPRLKLKKGFWSQEAAGYSQQICSAVDYLHKNSIMHRDIKPENILLTLNTIKICDFGWSVYNPQKVLRSTLCGTPLYLAPQLIAQTEYGEAVDIWAIGIITYEMLTEEIPFQINKPSDLYRILSDEIRIERIRNKVAADFIQRALEKNANKRVNISELCLHPFVQVSPSLFL